MCSESNYPSYVSFPSFVGYLNFVCLLAISHVCNSLGLPSAGSESCFIRMFDGTHQTFVVLSFRFMSSCCLAGFWSLLFCFWMLCDNHLLASLCL